jgi:hypothetical protein
VSNASLTQAFTKNDSLEENLNALFQAIEATENPVEQWNALNAANDFYEKIQIRVEEAGAKVFG